jgi:hypothetical protein
VRTRGPRPALADSEVIAIEIAGEFWGHVDDRALYRRYHAAEFPALAQVDRTTFARQAANLCWLKRRLQRRLAGRLADPQAPWLIDSFPLPVCRFARARTSCRFVGMAAYGFSARSAFRTPAAWRVDCTSEPSNLATGDGTSEQQNRLRSKAGRTRGVRLLERAGRGFAPEATVADLGAGLRAGQQMALPEVPCRGDVFHPVRDLEQTPGGPATQVAPHARPMISGVKGVGSD